MSDRKSLQALNVSVADKAVMDLCDKANISKQCFFRLPDSFRPPVSEAQFLYWIPNPLPAGNSISVTSSRLSQKLESYSDWFDALRTLAVRLSKDDCFLISEQGTTSHEYLARISTLFKIPLVSFQPFPSKTTQNWIEERKTNLAAEKSPRVYYMPLNDGKSPGRDLILNTNAIRTYALSVGSNGNVFRSLQCRLSSAKDSTTHVLVNERLTKKKTRKKLIDAGATDWYLFGTDKRGDSAPANRPVVHANATPVLSLDEVKTSDFLLHWTRRRVGAWPDQSRNEFLDDLIFQNRRHHHNEFSALCRILSSRRILGSHQLTRDLRDVVCFSDIAISELPSKRVFRPHLSRWDFEPYGIALDRNFLMSLGARPVIYGTESDWEILTDEERPYFQLASTHSKDIDWKTEREWRIVGDLNLKNVPRDQAIVFVNRYEEAQTIGELCHWPVLVLSQ